MNDDLMHDHALVMAATVLDLLCIYDCKVREKISLQNLYAHMLCAIARYEERAARGVRRLEPSRN